MKSPETGENVFRNKLSTIDNKCTAAKSGVPRGQSHGGWKLLQTQGSLFTRLSATVAGLAGIVEKYNV